MNEYTTQTPLKQCTHKNSCVHPEACDGWLPLTKQYFAKNRRKPDGWSSWCKCCQKTYMDKWAEKNRERKREFDRTYYVANQEAIKAKTKQYAASHREEIRITKADWRNRNRDKTREYQRAYYQRHRERLRAKWASKYEKTREKRAAERKQRRLRNMEHCRMVARKGAIVRRAKKKQIGGTITTQDIQLQYKSQCGKCWWCGKRVGDTYHVDHVIPLSRGGTNDPRNIVIACPECNLRKNRKLPHEWIGRLF